MAPPICILSAPEHVTGGLAVTKLDGDFLFTDGAAGIGTGALQSARISTTEVGYTAGGGIEAGITDRLSLKAEYLHVNFDHLIPTQTGNNIPTLAGLGLSQTFTQSMDLKANIFRVGGARHHEKLTAEASAANRV